MSIYRFPSTKWDEMDDYNGISEQVHVVAEECGELASALRKDGPQRLAEETWDVIHAAEGVLRRLEANGLDVSAARDAVENKNRDRGYYVSDITQSRGRTEQVAIDSTLTCPHGYVMGSDECESLRCSHDWMARCTRARQGDVR